ncbi:replicative DNA helicase [Clostridium malenominatum]|uniref:DNA 5'-3' helicase n=1 Tax=Clostridium malenominatum TaxID=1539 RepID=A0ABP3UCQ8_9CLOT
MDKLMNQIRNAPLEQAVLGSIILNNELWFQVMENNIEKDYFYFNNHKKLFNIMKKLNKRDEVIDITTLGNYIVKNNLTDKITITYLSKLATTVPSTIGFKSYIKELKRYKEKRDIMNIMQYIQMNFHKENGELKDEITEKVLRLNTVDKRDKGDIKEGIERFIQDVEFRITNKDKILIGGLQTGLRTLDLTLDGFEPGDLITVVARSGIGKTTFATSVILNMVKKGYRVGIFSMEMPKEHIIKKMAFNHCSIDPDKYKKGEVSKEEVTRLIEFTQWLEDRENFFIYGESNFNNITSKIKSQHLKTGLDIVFIDYLNKIQGVKEGTRDMELNLITSTLKDIALGEKICIVALTQANRQVDKQSDKRLTLADIKDSSSIEQNSDKILALYRNKNLDNPLYKEELFNKGRLSYLKANADVNPECIELEVLKCRMGDCKTIACKWNGKYSRISNW